MAQAQIRYIESCTYKVRFFDLGFFQEVQELGPGCEILFKNGKSVISSEPASTIMDRVLAAEGVQGVRQMGMSGQGNVKEKEG
jgi:hypothetical protein